MTKPCIVVYLFLCSVLSSFAQTAPSIQFSATFGGSKQDNGERIIQTRDKGYLIGGITVSDDGQVKGFHPGSNPVFGDVWIVKTDATGKLLWSTILGGTHGEELRVVAETDKAYVIGGYTWSKDGDFTNMNSVAQNGYIAWLDKSTGKVQKIRPYSGDHHGELNDLKIIEDKYMIAIGSNAMKKGKFGIYSARDVWIAKLNMDGDIIWEKYYGSSGDDHGHVITRKTPLNGKERGFVLAAHVNTNDHEISGVNGSYDAWIAVLDSNGNLTNSKCFGGAKEDQIWQILETTVVVEGGIVESEFLCVGFTASSDGDIKDNKGKRDYWAIKMRENQWHVMWSKCFGGSNDDNNTMNAFTDDNGVIMTGWTTSTNGLATGNNGLFEQLLIRLDKDGQVQWSKMFGSTIGDAHGAVTPTCDNGYAFTAMAGKVDKDVSGNSFGLGEVWLCKLSPDGLNNRDCGNWPSRVEDVDRLTQISVVPNPASNYIMINHDANTHIFRLVIKNIAGQAVLSNMQVASASRIDLPSLPAGLYFIHLETSNGLRVEKLVLQ